ncbi:MULTISPECIES: hypothetical protein [unclassified Variovorax]|uniref:hypothetical protein n=1 Tax=unclassified Variovorax TaxID=663243 RepID=UPI0008383B55|nr:MULTISPECIES: hypothetical protein [unclassified Variovorax]PNG46894.1 hypothetical protein CHC06_07237 [Variovorax sp. B2]PNG48455.1 hypothetical protein CHC07_07631 [Variovorax sp. B4]VTV14722.1 hypothetical protein WDL1CHR_05211 [Variovorax sp. WDL1]
MAAVAGKGFANPDLDAPTRLALLHRLAREPLPVILTDDADVESVSTLVRAGQLEATLQVVLPAWLGSPQPGLVVRGITRPGWMTLAAHVLDSPGVIDELSMPDRPGALTPTLSQRERE